MPPRLRRTLAIMLLAAVAHAQEPNLQVVRAPLGITIEIQPDAALPVPMAWNLYRGALQDVAMYQQYGDPDGRCAVPGTDTSIPLLGEHLLPGAHYYLLSAVDGTGLETGLGDNSFGLPRPNLYPCPALQACGTEILPSVSGTEGIAIGPDGTLYYSQSGVVARRRPGMAAENPWITLPATGTVWGMALRDDGILFVGSPRPTGVGNVYRIDTTQVSPTPQVLYTPAGGANGVTVGPDGACYYSDFNAGRVYRVDDAGTRTQVTASTIASANGLLFDDDGTLLVLAYGSGTVYRLTLNASMAETARVVAGTFTGARLDGIAKDVSGRYYVSDNGGGRLLRADASFGNQEILMSGIPAAANIAFGKGALDCLDAYVASSGLLARFHADVTGRP